LDAAMQTDIPMGGLCPKGRLSEGGTIQYTYPLVETDSKDYSIRTEMNVMHADGTLILNIGELYGGTEYTIECAVNHK
jgi:hypothetical protein